MCSAEIVRCSCAGPAVLRHFSKSVTMANKYWTLSVIVIFINLAGLASGSGGTFSLSIKNFTNPYSTTDEGQCCYKRELAGNCTTPCRTRFRICVKNYQISIDPEGPCYIGEANTLVNSGTSFSDLGEWDFVFKFRWPGTFSLIIEAWHDETQRNTDIGRRALISRLAIQQWLSIGQEWRPRTFTSPNGHSFVYSYRVVCLENYYGESCDKYCKPRNDKFGHYNCSANGEVVCLNGWEGEYCMAATCTPQCTHGSCTAPNQCTCPLGYTGPDCSQCQTYPGCKHGTCSQPWQCECSEGWGGLFCNQDLNYCTNHKPCKNGGTCFNTGQGSYTCSCTLGYTGLDCSKKLDEDESCKCENGGVCNQDSECVCGPEFGGARCEVKIGCNCSNGGVCNGGVCICPMGTYGPNCEVSFCEGNQGPCANGGQCNEISRNCSCTGVWTGSNCTQCACQNGGVCTGSGMTSACNCPPEYTGNLCSFPNATYTLGMLKTFEEELTYDHIVLVIIASIACPLLLIIGVAVVWILKKRRQKENERLDAIATQQNEENCDLNLRKGIIDSSSSNSCRLSTNNLLNINVKTKDSNLWNSSAAGGKLYEKGGSLNMSHLQGGGGMSPGNGLSSGWPEDSIAVASNDPSNSLIRLHPLILQQQQSRHNAQSASGTHQMQIPQLHQATCQPAGAANTLSSQNNNVKASNLANSISYSSQLNLATQV